MRRPTFCLSALVALAACGKGRSLPVDASASARDAAPADGDAADATRADTTPADGVVPDAPMDAASGRDSGSDARDAADGGRVPYRAIAVATGEVQTCAILDDHKVKCWGDNSFGELGYGDELSRGSSSREMGDALPTLDLGTGRTALEIAAGRYSTCAILDDGSLRCWGWNGLGAVGAPNNVGDEPGEMGDHLRAADFGGRKAVHLAMGEYNACASTDDDTIWCWGEGERPRQQAQLPAKRVRAFGPAEGGVIAVYEDGTLSPVLPDGTTSLTFARKVVAVAGGVGESTCVLLDDGTTTCVDDLGPRPGPADVVAIGAERVDGLCAAKSNGTITCRWQMCTQPTYYQCEADGSFTLGAAVVAVTSNGTFFACALLADGAVKCWGTNLTMPPAAWLGAGIDYTQTDGGITYGPWRAVDLGTHP